MALPAIPAGAIYVSGIISGALVRFGTKKAAQNFISQFGGKIVTSAKAIKNKKVVSSTASSVKNFVNKIKNKFKSNKDDMIALTTKKKPSGGKLTTTTKPKSTALTKPKTTALTTKPKPININMPKRINKPMTNVTPPRGGGGGGGTKTGGGGRTGSPRTNPRAGANLRKTVLALLQNKDSNINQTAVGDPSPKKPDIGIKPKVTVKTKPKKDVPIAVKKRTLKKKPKNVPVATKKRRTSPISKPDLSGLTGKFGVKGFSRTGSTMTDFLIGFTDGKGGKGRNYDKFMAKDKNGQYKVKTDTLKSMGKRLKEKMKKKK